MIHRRLPLLLLTLALAVPAHGQSYWEEMDVGLTVDQVSLILGQPLIMTGGHGFEQWIFDAGGSVMFHQGAVLFWGIPKGFRSVEHVPRLGAVQPPVESPAAKALPPGEPSPSNPRAVPPSVTKVRSAIGVKVASFDEITKS